MGRTSRPHRALKNDAPLYSNIFMRIAALITACLFASALSLSLSLSLYEDSSDVSTNTSIRADEIMNEHVLTLYGISSLTVRVECGVM